jgi:hypothetical protein
MMAMLRRFIALLYGFNGLGALERVQERGRPRALEEHVVPASPQLKTRWAIPPKANPAKRGRALGRVALQYSQELLENNDKGTLMGQKTLAFSGL